MESEPSPRPKPVRRRPGQTKQADMSLQTLTDATLTKVSATCARFDISSAQCAEFTGRPTEHCSLHQLKLQSHSSERTPACPGVQALKNRIRHSETFVARRALCLLRLGRRLLKFSSVRPSSEFDLPQRLRGALLR
jgi:hypothetical protein